MEPRKLQELIEKQASALRVIDDKIVSAVRPLIPVLKDAGRMHSAAPLDELFFERDALLQAMTQLLREHGPDILQMLLESRPSRRRPGGASATT